MKYLSKSYDFRQLKESLIKGNFVSDLADKELTESLLRIPNLDIDKTLSLVQAKEAATFQTKEIRTVWQEMNLHFEIKEK